MGDAISDREFGLAIREAVLLFLDAIERKFNISPRTAEIREWFKISNKIKEGYNVIQEEIQP